MNPIFYLGLSVGILALPFGFVLGFNSHWGDEIKRFNESKGSVLKGVIE